MTDLISRADAIKIVLTYFIPRSHTGERGEHEEDFVRTIFKALPSADAVSRVDGTNAFDSLDEEVVSAEAVQGWIPCSERLPDVGKNVLFTTDIYGGYVAEGDRRTDGKWWQYRWNTVLKNEDVVAWMPLPKPYKGGDADES